MTDHIFAKILLYHLWTGKNWLSSGSHSLLDIEIEESSNYSSTLQDRALCTVWLLSLGVLGPDFQKILGKT